MKQATERHTITPSDILSLDDFIRGRPAMRQEIVALKAKRRVGIGPDVMVYFENKRTLLWQIQEMLYIERGGDEQMADEIAAYAPLVPQGNDLVATMMIEIDDFHRRRVTLAQLGHIEHEVEIRFSGHTVKGIPTDDAERTTAQGKTSSVHFIHFHMNDLEKDAFKIAGSVTLAITHPRYSFEVNLPQNSHQEIMQDLD